MAKMRNKVGKGKKRNKKWPARQNEWQGENHGKWHSHRSQQGLQLGAMIQNGPCEMQLATHLTPQPESLYINSTGISISNYSNLSD